MFRLFRKKRKIGLALSGGAVRGIAHVGVLKVLIKHDIPIDYIAGTSAGAIVGSLYASGMSIEAIEQAVMDMDWKKVITPSLSLKGIFTSQKIKTLMEKLLPVRTFGETILPLSIVATDLLNANEFIFHKKDEDIATAIQASCTIPGVFDPVHYKGHVLVDGCIANNMPVSVVKEMGADRVIGVNLITANLKKEPDNIFKMLSRINDAYEIANLKKYEKDTDLIITPLDEAIDHFTSSRPLYQKLIKLGEQEAERHLGKVKKLL